VERVLLEGCIRPDVGHDGNAVPSVARDAQALGFANSAEIGPGVKAVAVQEEDGQSFVSAGANSVARLEYPLARAGILHALSEGQDVDDVAEFMAFALSEAGQVVVNATGPFQGLVSPLVARERLRLMDWHACQLVARQQAVTRLKRSRAPVGRRELQGASNH
jgi:hypothetical protein